MSRLRQVCCACNSDHLRIGEPPPISAYCFWIFGVLNLVITFAKIFWNLPKGMISPSDCVQLNHVRMYAGLIFHLGKESYEESMQETSNFSLITRTAHVHKHHSSRSMFSNLGLCFCAELPWYLMQTNPQSPLLHCTETPSCVHDHIGDISSIRGNKMLLVEDNKTRSTGQQLHRVKVGRTSFSARRIGM